MPGIAGVDIPGNKQVWVSLQYIYGIGTTLSQEILAKTGITPDVKVNDLTEEEVNQLREVIDREYRVEGELRREVLGNIKRLKEINSYRGDRHAKRLPVRGQRTKTNSRTSRGNVRRTMGSGRRALTKT